MLNPVLKKNDKKANLLIISFSLIVFIAVLILGRIKLEVSLNMDVHLFARINAIINTCVSLLLLAALLAVKGGKYAWHRSIMLTAMALSILFLISYILHHLLAGDTRYGDMNHNGVLSEQEKLEAGSLRKIYYIILGTHIPLAGIILPFILFTAYRALVGEYARHKKLARFTWPVWFYVAVSGVIVYLMISPYYEK